MYSEDNSFEKIMSRMLGNENIAYVDKRPGSVIYDSIAPVAMELATAYSLMDILETQTYLMTSTGENLEKRAFDYGITRKSATKAQRIGEFKKYKLTPQGEYEKDADGNKILVPMDIPVGTRFAVIDSSETFIVIDSVGEYQVLECEQEGVIGNSYVGIILPMTPVQDLIESRITSTLKYGENAENDDDLRQRIIDSLVYTSFGGNIQDYTEKVTDIDGVGGVKVYPAWEYNGSVLLSVVDPEFNPVSAEFISQLKQKIDPEERSGEGIGIAPIGHHVTVTTPVEENIRIRVDVTLERGYTPENAKEDIVAKLQELFTSIRKDWTKRFDDDYVDIVIYRSRIINKILELEYVFDVKDVYINDSPDDLVLHDSPFPGEQFLPYVREEDVIIE